MYTSQVTRRFIAAVVLAVLLSLAAPTPVFAFVLVCQPYVAWVEELPWYEKIRRWEAWANRGWFSACNWVY